MTHDPEALRKVFTAIRRSAAGQGRNIYYIETPPVIRDKVILSRYFQIRPQEPFSQDITRAIAHRLFMPERYASGWFVSGEELGEHPGPKVIRELSLHLFQDSERLIPTPFPEAWSGWVGLLPILSAPPR